MTGGLGRGVKGIPRRKNIGKYLASLIGHSQSSRSHKSLEKAKLQQQEESLRSTLVLILIDRHSKLILCENQTEMESPCIPHKHLNCQE